MNHIKAALVGHTTITTTRASISASLFLPASCFHSTTVLERKKRRTQSRYRFNYYFKKTRNQDSERRLFRDMDYHAENLFHSWWDEEERCASSGPSWFRGHRWVRGGNRNGFHPNGFNSGVYRSKVAGGFVISSDDEDDGFVTSSDDEDDEFVISSDDEDGEPETLFRDAFGGIRFTYWSFDSRRKKTSSRASSQSSRKWRYNSDESENETEDTEKSSEVASACQTLGLRPSGPLKLEDVKIAYRACALRWHPDRHDGSSKVKAEEKFKHCSVAYKILCDSLATA